MVVWRTIRCRKGSAKILENLAEWWPIRQAPANILREQQLCGPGLPRGYWVCLNTFFPVSILETKQKNSISVSYFPS